LTTLVLAAPTLPVLPVRAFAFAGAFAFAFAGAFAFAFAGAFDFAFAGAFDFAFAGAFDFAAFFGACAAFFFLELMAPILHLQSPAATLACASRVPALDDRGRRGYRPPV
jgi:hypothetical protein